MFGKPFRIALFVICTFVFTVFFQGPSHVWRGLGQDGGGGVYRYDARSLKRPAAGVFEVTIQRQDARFTSQDRFRLDVEHHTMQNLTHLGPPQPIQPGSAGANLVQRLREFP